MITSDQRLTILAVREVAESVTNQTGSNAPLIELDPQTRRKWQNALFANINGLGFNDELRAARLRFLSLLFNRIVYTANDLTWPECHALVKAINAPTVGSDLMAIAREIINGVA